MYTLEEISEALRAARLEEVAHHTGLNYFTLVRYRSGQVKQPPLDTVQRISAWMDERGEGATAS